MREKMVTLAKELLTKFECEKVQIGDDNIVLNIKNVDKTFVIKMRKATKETFNFLHSSTDKGVLTVMMTDDTTLKDQVEFIVSLKKDLTESREYNFKLPNEMSRQEMVNFANEICNRILLSNEFDIKYIKAESTFNTDYNACLKDGDIRVRIILLPFTNTVKVKFSEMRLGYEDIVDAITNLVLAEKEYYNM